MGTSIWTKICISPFPVENFGYYLYPYTIPSRYENSPSKWRWVQVIPTGTSLFVISNLDLSDTKLI